MSGFFKVIINKQERCSLNDLKQILGAFPLKRTTEELSHGKTTKRRDIQNKKIMVGLSQSSPSAVAG